MASKRKESLKAEINPDSNQESLLSTNLENKKTSNYTFNKESNIAIQQECHVFINLFSNDTLEPNFPSNYEKQTKKEKKKRRKL